MRNQILILLLFSNTMFGQLSNPRKADTLDVEIGKINKYDLVYDCLDCYQMNSGGIRVFYKNKNGKHLLFERDLEGFYIIGVSLLKIKNDSFIYVDSGHTFGHSQGYLYFLNEMSMKAYEVKIKAKHKLPANTYINKYFDLTKDEHNHFGFGATTRSESADEEDYIKEEYTLKKIKDNEYVLVNQTQ